MSRQLSRIRSFMRLASVLIVTFVASGGAPPVANALSFQRISGEGSSWAANAIDAMRVNVRSLYGITVDFNPSGSTAGRKNFLNGTVDFAASDIPFQFAPEDGSAPESPAPGSYAYIPVVAGGTAFMYNLQINGKRVTNLRLSPENVTKIFTGKITNWNDPALQADNPGLVMPARAVVPVVRSDGSGASAQFTKWMIALYPNLWTDYCNDSGRAPACGYTSFYPTIPGMISQSGDLGVSGYVSQGFAEGAIGYVNYSYALGVQFPVAKMLNAAGFYTEPTPQNVAVSLLQARINTDASDPTVYLTQQLEGVYADTDPRSYSLSSYSYLIVPTVTGGQFNEEKGKTLGAFAYYAMCQAQQQSASLGYSPMPINLVEASFDQIRKIPGVEVQDIAISSCKNPTFSADGSNLLADTAPQPQACDKQGSASQCPNGTGGLPNQPTDVSGLAVVPAPVVTTPGGAVVPVVTTPGGAVVPVVTTPGGAVVPVVTTPGGAVVPGVTVPGAVATPEGVAGVDAPAIDPETGEVITGSASDGVSDGVVAPGAVGPVLSTVLPQSSTSVALLMLVILLTLALVLAPAVAWRHFAQRGPA